MADDGHPRLVLHDFFSLDLCKELEFIHKSCCTVGYRPNVFSTTLSHLIATNCAHLIMPFVPIRERLKEKVEEFFGCEYELVIEFTGLISWTRGASIGWHSDDNRPYLKQREYAAVCYLNTYGDHFGGGVFHFQEGEPSVIVPVAGDVAIYTADSRNIHSVDEITDGERLTLTLWFTRDTTHDEDAKLMSFLSRSPLDSNLPLPAANDMYWFPADQASKYQYGFDIRCARLHVLGFDVYPSRDYCSSSSELDSNSNFLELLMEPLQLARGDELFDKDFLNILHVLQVVQLHAWKRTSEVRTNTITNNILALSQSQRKRIHELKLVFSKDHRLVKTVFSCNSFKMDCCFDWPSFCAAVEAWEVYTSKLCKQLAMSLPLWTTHYSIFFVPLMDLAEEQP